MATAGGLPVSLKESFYWSKWLTFVMCAVINLSAGLVYSYGNYSGELKRRFGLSQLGVSGIGTAANTGGYLALPAGFFYDSLRRYNRKGPLFTILVGAALCFAGYLYLYLTDRGDFESPYWGLCLAAAVGANGQAWIETGGLVTSVRNFDTDRGTVIGILKAFLGLSASVYTAIYLSFLDPDATSFLLLLAVLPAVMAVLCCGFINYVPYVQVEPHTKSHAFHLACTAVIGMALYEAVIALARNQGAMDASQGILVTSAIGILLLPMVAISWIFGGLRSRRLRDLSPPTPEAAPAPVAAGRQSGQGEMREVLRPFLESGDSSREDPYGAKTPLQCLRSQAFWLVFLTNTVCSGAGLALLNNLAQLVEAVGGAGTSPAVFVSTFSIANCLGRLSSGFIPDQLMVSRREVPRTLSVVFLAALTTASSLLTAFASLPVLALCAGLGGFCFGSFQGAIPAVVSELFGLRAFATNYALMQLGPALGSYTMATELTGLLYEAELRRQGRHGTCLGPWCFRWTFLGCAALGALGVLSAALVWRRTLPLYRRVIAVTKAERQRRGLQGEFQAGREILKQVAIENGQLHQLFSRGKALVGRLEASLPGDATPQLSQAAAALGSLVRDAEEVVQEQERLYNQYQSLSSLQLRLTG